MTNVVVAAKLQLWRIGVFDRQSRGVNKPVDGVFRVNRFDLLVRLADVNVGYPLFLQMVDVVAALFVRAGNGETGLRSNERQRSYARTSNPREIDMHRLSLACYTGEKAKIKTMHKRQLHHLWTKIRPIKVWYLLTAFLVLATISVFTLR